MGHIIGLSFNDSGEDRAWLDPLIRSAPYFAGYDEQSQAYAFRDPDAPAGGDPTPDCEVWIRGDGLEFNWLSGERAPKVVYEFLVERLRARLVQVRENF